MGATEGQTYARTLGTGICVVVGIFALTVNDCDIRQKATVQEAIKTCRETGQLCESVGRVLGRPNGGN